jgi:ERF superfamily
MGRPKLQKPLVDKIAEAFAKVEKLQRNGSNATRGYKWTRASDVLAAVRADLLNRGVLIHINEGKPEYERNVAQSNDGEPITECNLPITYVFMDSAGELKPMTINGVGRDVEDKALYKAQTGAQKALLKRFGLMTEDDEPEPENELDASTDGAQEMREAEARKPPKQPKTVTITQIRAFNDACRDTGKSQDEVSGYLLTMHQVSKLADLGRGRPFTQALAWANQKPPSLALAPKPQPAPAMQPRLPLPAPAIELRIGNQTVTVEPKTKSYAL